MKWPFANDDIFVEKSRLSDVHELADIHRGSFGRGWSADEFTRLVESDEVRAFQCKRPASLLRGASREVKGFVLARVAADEAEILSIAVAQDARGFGLAKALMQAIMSDLYADRIDTLFLEVDESNTAAVRLYKTLGFRQVGERKSYYTPQEEAGEESGTRPRALVMRLDLR